MTAGSLPPEANALVAQVEDELSVWADRDPARHHPDVRKSGERACKLIGDLILVLQGLRDRITAEVGEYDDARRRLR